MAIEWEYEPSSDYTMGCEEWFARVDERVVSIRTNIWSDDGGFNIGMRCPGMMMDAHEPTIEKAKALGERFLTGRSLDGD